MLNYLIGAAISIAVTTSAFAQSETPSWDPVAAGRLGVLVDGTRKPSQVQRQGSSPASEPATSSARARATCANKGAARAKRGANDPQVRKLYALCAQAGY